MTSTAPAGTGARLILISSGAEMALPDQRRDHCGEGDPSSGIFPDVDLTPHGGEDGGVSRRRRTFYPLSDDPSTRDHRITMTDFRLCLAVDLAVRQAFAIALNNRFPTGLSLPSRASVTLWEATAPVKLPTIRGLGPRFGVAVRHQDHKGWYFTFRLHAELAPPLQSLPPILHIAVLMPA